MKAYPDGERCESCGQVKPETQAPPWEAEEFERIRPLEHVGKGQSHLRLRVYSPPNDAGVMIADEEMAHAGSRSPILNSTRVHLTPDEAVWLYLQLDELLNHFPPPCSTNAVVGVDESGITVASKK